MIDNIQQNLIENKENLIENQNIFFKYFRWKYVFILILIFLNPLKLNIVLDSETYLPVSDAVVEYKRSNWADGCGKEIQIKTFIGLSVSPFISFPCAVTISALGYHKNGTNHITPSLKIARVTFLKKHKLSDQNFVRIKKQLYVNNGTDVLTFANNKIATNIDNFKEEVNFDFIISDIVYGGLNDFARFKFNSNGGVQLISDMPAIRSGGEYHFDLENLIEAPVAGYSQELDIVSGKSYVAKLQDGKHYMKFRTFISENFEDRKPYICITGFLNLKEDKNLDFFDTGDSNDFSCDYEKEDGDLEYNDQVKFSIFQKDFSGELIAQKYQFQGNFYLKPKDINSNEWYWLSGISTNQARDISLGDVFTAKIPSKEDFLSNKFNFDYNYSSEGMPITLYSKGKEYHAKIHRLETINVIEPKNEDDLFFKRSFLNDDCESSKPYPDTYKECLEVSF